MTTATLPEVKLPVEFAREKGLPRFVAVAGVKRRTAKAALLDLRWVVRASDFCSRCGRPIHNDASKLVGIGPDCCEYLGVERPSFETASAILATLQAELLATPLEAWVPNYLLPGCVLALPDAEPEAVAPASPDAVLPAQPPAPPANPRRVELAGAGFLVRFPYDPALVAAVRDITGARWNPGDKVWGVPPAAKSADELLVFIRRYDFLADAGVIAAAEELNTSFGTSLAASKAESAELDLSHLGLGREPFPFQRAGIAYMLAHPRSINADDMGLGKSLESIVAVRARGSLRCVVVCPASVKLNWAREIALTLPSAAVAVLDGKPSAAALDGVRWVVLNYDILAKWLPTLHAWAPDALIADEAHYLKNHKAARTKAVAELAKGLPTVYFLTGTPIMNRPSELLSPLGILGHLGAFGGWGRFAFRFCGAVRTAYGLDLSGASNLDELHDTLRATCLVRRMKDDVLADLPAKTRTVVPVELTNRAEYARAEADIAQYVAKLAVEDREFRASIAHLSVAEQERDLTIRARQAALAAKRAEVLVKMGHLRQLAAKGKLDTVREWVTDFLASGRKLVLFAWHQSVIDAFAAEFGCDTITGQTPVAKRQAAVDRFQQDPEAKLLVCNIQAGGVGITLTAASDVAFVELAWRPGDLEQAEDRCRRIGQAYPVTAWYFTGVDSVDEQMYELVEAKRTVVTAATDGGAQGKTTTTILGGALRALVAKHRGDAGELELDDEDAG